MEQTVYIVLENGTVFEGKNFGAPIDSVTGEMVFTTSMTGYLETLSDPSYWGQIVVQTFPLIGNYGVIPLISKAAPSGPALILLENGVKVLPISAAKGTLTPFLRKRAFLPSTAWIHDR